MFYSVLMHLSFGFKSWQLPGFFIFNIFCVQVHGYFDNCPGRSDITCVCGGAVQSGGDVFVYDKCRKDYPDRIRLYSCDDMSLSFNKPSEGVYEVCHQNVSLLELIL